MTMVRFENEKITLIILRGMKTMFQWKSLKLLEVSLKLTLSIEISYSQYHG